ncbi:MAG TPA: 4a-hydroxytetrahydrobiopterin dehydratase, partial [Planctomycetaceae bacterium]
HCTACEGNTSVLSTERIRTLLSALPEWDLADDGKRIRREWLVKDFAAGLEFFQHVGQVAEAEDHHPDLFLTDFRDVAVELSTHAAGGLTENDFIVAAKIDAVPVSLKK